MAKRQINDIIFFLIYFFLLHIWFSNKSMDILGNSIEYVSIVKASWQIWKGLGNIIWNQVFIAHTIYVYAWLLRKKRWGIFYMTTNIFVFVSFFTCKKFQIKYIKCNVDEFLISSGFRISFDRLNYIAPLKSNMKKGS